MSLRSRQFYKENAAALTTAIALALLLCVVDGKQLWDFEQPGFVPYAFQGGMLDSGTCTLPVIDVFGAVHEGTEWDEAAGLRMPVPAPDRARWRAFLAHGEHATPGGTASPVVHEGWHTRKRALLHFIARQKRPVVLRGLLDAARTQRAWDADMLTKRSVGAADALGDTPLAGAGAPPFQITYDDVAAGGRMRDDGHPVKAISTVAIISVVV